MISKRLGSVSLVVALLGAAACGSSAKKVDPAADLATAKSAVLTAADLPGYTGAVHQKSDDLPAAQKKDFATCMGVATTIFDDTPGAQKADSEDFSKGTNDEYQVSNSVEIDPKKSEIESTWKAISDPRAAGCLQKLFQALFTSGAAGNPNAKFAAAKVVKFDPKVGDRSIGYAVTFSASDGTHAPVAFFGDVLFMPRDRAGMELQFFQIGSAPDRALETALAQKVYDRVGTHAK